MLVGGGVTAGLFISHIRYPRVVAHFERLVSETAGLIDWEFVFNPGNTARPVTSIPYGDPAAVLASRYGAMVRHGGVQGGFLDVVIIPCVLAQRHEHVWVMEYDVDFAGPWGRFFAEFTDEPADVLTSTLASISDTPEWWRWSYATAPPWVRRAHLYRGFHPLLRLSKRFAQMYAVMMADSRWGGHYEYTIPTAAAAGGATLLDIGGDRPGGSRAGHPAHYSNDPSHPDLAPGTFVWRPVRSKYFHEAPETFALPNRLYHPVKADVADWDAPDPPGRHDH